MDGPLRSSLNLLSSMIGQRTRTSQEFWLIDISALDSIENAEILFENFNLRINDDIFVVKFDEDFMSADVWEIYKISMDQPIINNYLGAWSENDGLNMTTLEKYQRRSDLMVILGVPG
jgi:hypothetical protein